MGVAVIADLMAGLADGARNRGQPLDISAALEEGRRGPVSLQDFQNLGSALARAVVEGQRDDPPVARTAPVGAAEDRGRTAAHRPRQKGGGTRDRSHGAKHAIHCRERTLPRKALRSASCRRNPGCKRRFLRAARSPTIACSATIRSAPPADCCWSRW